MALAHINLFTHILIPQWEYLRSLPTNALYTAAHLMAPVVAPPPPPPSSSVATSHHHSHHPLSMAAAAAAAATVPPPPGLIPHLQHVQSSAAIYQMNQQFLSAAAAASAPSVLPQQQQQHVLPGSMYVAAPVASSSIRIQATPETMGSGAQPPLDLQALDPSHSGLISFTPGAQVRYSPYSVCR